MDTHFNINAEQNVIFAIVTGTAHTPRLLQEIKSDDFMDPNNERIFENLHKAYIAGQLAEYTGQVIGEINTPENMMPLWSAAKTVINHSIRRKTEIAMASILELVRDYSNDITSAHRQVRDVISEAIDPRACKVPSKTVDDTKTVQAGMMNNEKAFYTGIPQVDISAPIQPGDFVVLGARPGVGKSAVATGMILENFLGNDRKRGLFFCIEMDARQSYSRLSSQMSGVELRKYINSRTFKATKREITEIAASICKIEDEFPEEWFIQGGVTLEEVISMVEIHKPDWIMIDYVQILKTEKKFRDNVERLNYISTELRNLALKTGVAVIALAQLNRDAHGLAPSISQIKGCGQFEQDATHIFLLDRPESERTHKDIRRSYFNREGNEVSIYNSSVPTNLAAMLTSKNRNGPTFFELLRFHPETTSFESYE